jgi:VCBS repeat-containing protein
VTAVNDVPSFTVGANQSVLEDSGLHTVNGFIGTFSPGPANEAGQTVDFITSNDNNALFSAQPTIDASGNLTYTSAANANGSATVTVQIHDNGGTANGGVDTSASQTFTVTVGQVNDAPAGTDNNTIVTLEDTSHTFTAAEFGFSDPVDAANASGGNAFQAVKITTVPGVTGTLTNNGTPVNAGDSVLVTDINLGHLVFTPAANANGSPEASFTFQVQDNGGTANSGVDTDQSANTIQISVTSVNDAPAGADNSIFSVGAHTFVAADFGFTDPVDAASTAGPNNLLAVKISTVPASGTLTNHGNPVIAGDSISLSDINGGFFVFTPSGNSTGSFTFQVQDDGGTANLGVDLDPSANTLTIVQNTAPTATDDALSATEKGGVNNATAGTDPTGNVITGTGGATADTDAETPGSLTVVSFGTGASGGTPGVVDGTTQLTGDHGSLTLDSAGNFHYFVNQTDPAVQALVPASPVLTDTFHYTIQDPGGLTSTAVITVSIHGANDLPGAVADAQTITEDAGAPIFTVRSNDSLDPDTGALNTVAPGSVTVTSAAAGTSFANTDATAAAVNSGHDIQVTLGAAFQQLHAGETATVTVPYTLTGNGAETSTVNLVLTVNGANDVPVAVDDSGSMTEDQSGTAFTVLTGPGADTLDPDHGAANNVTTTGTITNLVAPSGESIDASDISVTANGSNQLVVTFVGSDFQHMKQGETTTFDVDYTLHGDQPGDTSTAHLHVTVNGVNDGPTANNVSFTGANSANYNTDLVVNDPTDGAPTTTGPFKGITASLLSLSGASDVDGPNSPLQFVAGTVATTDGGSVTIQADGDFVFTPKVGDANASDSFSFTVTDGNPGTAGTVTKTATVNFNGPHIWYVNSATGSDSTGDGSSEHPFASLAPLNGTGNNGSTSGDVDSAGDTIYLENGTYSSGITLENNEKLISRSQGLVVSDGAGGAGTVTLDAASGSNATINGTVTLASGNTIDGVTLGNTSGFSLQDSGATVGTATVAHSSISNANGGAVSIANGGTLAMNFSSIASTGSTAEGIKLGGVGGSFAVSGTTAITDADTTGIQVSNTAAGASFNFGTSTSVTDSAIGSGHNGNGIDLSTSIGATNSFSFGNTSITTDAGFGLKAVSAGTLTFGATNSVNATGGAAVDLTSTALSGATFGTVSSSGSANYGINLVNESSGTFTASGGTIGTANTAGVHISGGTAAASIASAINSSNGEAVDISSHGTGQIDITGTINHTSGGDKGIVVASNTSGTINFTGQTTIASTTANGVDLTSNGSSTINFNAAGNGLDITTTSGIGFNATGGATAVNVQGSGNSISSTTGTALNVNGTNIGSNNLVFHDITSNGGSDNGINLVNTGTAAGNGGLHVLGSGANVGATGGGVIANKTGADGSTTQGSGIYLNNTKDVQLNGLQMNDFQNYGIVGTNVAGFSLDHTTMNGSNGTLQSGIGEGDVYFTGLTGSASVSNSSFTGAAYDGFHVFNNSAQTLNRITISDSNFGVTNTGGNDALAFQATDGTFNATVQHSTFTAARGDLFQLDLHGGVSSDLVFGSTTAGQGNTLTNNNANIVSGGGGVTISSGGAGDHASLTFNIAHNSMRDALGSALGISTGSGTGSFNGTIDSNTIGVSGVLNSGSAQGTDIGFVTLGGADSSVTVTNNSLFEYAGTGMLIQTGDAVDGGNHKLTAVVQGNTISSPGTNNGQNGFLLNAGTVTGDAQTVSLTLGGPGALTNHFAGSGSGGSSDIRLRDRFDVKVGLHAGGGQDYIGGPTDSAAITTFVQNNNTGTPSVSVVTGNAGSGFYSAPMLAVDGGVQALSPTAGETHLTQAELDAAVAAAIGQWALAGASASQLAALHSAVVTVADLPDNVLGQENSGHIQIDTDAAGNGWFIDPTPNGNSEFAHAANAAGTDLYTDPTNGAAGHMDLVTVVAHELGHVLGMPDETDPATANDLMYINLVDGERRLPDASDVTQASDTAVAENIEAALPSSAQAAAGTPIVTGTPANDTIDAGHGGNILFGGGGADNFVFGPSTPLNAPTPAQVTHVADYHAAEGDTFDFSAITSAFHNSGVNDALVVRAVEDASGKFATLQVDHIDPMGLPSAPNWVNVAQLDGAHSGDAVNVLIDNHSVHLAQIHVDLLV